MNIKGIVFIMVLISTFSFTAAQEKIIIVSFDQTYEVFPNGNLDAVWDITIIPEGSVKTMLLHVFFSQKASIEEMVVKDAQGSLNSRMLFKEGVPILEIDFRDRLLPGEEYHFTCIMEVWKAVDMGETEGTFTLLTGYNFPIETLNISTTLPENTRVRNIFPADGQISSSGKKTTLLWSMNSLPSGYNIQISISFDVLSEEFAEMLFADGENLYNLRDLTNAETKFQQALAIYESLNLQGKIDDCETYLIRIEGLREALPILQDARNLLNNGNYREALTQFKEVKSIFQEHDISTREIDEYIHNSTTYIQAYDELQSADDALASGDTDAALTHLRQAREFFIQVKDTQMVDTIDEKIDSIPSPEPQSEPRSGTGLFFLLIIIALAALGGIILLRKREKPPIVQTTEDIKEEMRQLKARYVYGEINKREYDEQLSQLEEQLKAIKSQ
jgi:tetratricopeptide (TPR) repeat protein